MKWCSIFLSIVCFLAAGCQRGTMPPAALPEASSPDQELPTKPQPKLATLKLWLGAEEMSAELALTPMQIRTGMMFRTNMDENAGMLFVFGSPMRASFWMKNCPMSLSAAYIDPEGAILEIRDFEAQNTNAIVANSDRIQYVLETSRGWFERKKIAVGTVVRTERGTLRQTFFGN